MNFYREHTNQYFKICRNRKIKDIRMHDKKACEAASAHVWYLEPKWLRYSSIHFMCWN